MRESSYAFARACGIWPAGALALRHGVVLHELTPQQASLEQAFMDLTRDDVEFRAEELEEGALV